MAFDPDTERFDRLPELIRQAIAEAARPMPTASVWLAWHEARATGWTEADFAALIREEADRGDTGAA